MFVVFVLDQKHVVHLEQIHAQLTLCCIDEAEGISVEIIHQCYHRYHVISKFVQVLQDFASKFGERLMMEHLLDPEGFYNQQVN